MRPVALIIAYPLVTHIGVMTNNPYPVWVVLGLLFLWFLFSLPVKNNVVRMAYLLAGAGVFAVLVWLSANRFVVFFFPPVLISISLLMLFGNSLLSGTDALVTQIARLQHGGEMTERYERYTRAVTLVWTLFFAALTLETILLAVFASLETWSLYTNLLNYVFVLALFAIEYKVRITRFREMKHPGFIRFLRILTQIDMRSLRQ